MIVYTVALKAKPGKEKELVDVLIDMVSKTQNEKGALTYTLHCVKGEEGRFFFYEKYKDQAAVDFHNSTPYVKELVVKLESILDEEMIFNHYEEIASISRLAC